MAGSKTWSNGDTLTASDLNGYVRDQVITICTSGTRPSTTQEGRTIYETDTNRYYHWDGSAWQLASPTGVWLTFSPTWSNVTLGSPGQLSQGRYMVVGKTMWFSANFTLGTGGSVTGNIGMGNLPFAAVSSIARQIVCGMVSATDTAPVTTHIDASGTGTGWWFYGDALAVGSGAPGSWVAGSWGAITGCIEIA